ncbi:MAG: hypothetical protein ACI9IP_001099 [Arcticibacterium sp.]|jgi:hypothetical protein
MINNINLINPKFKQGEINGYSFLVKIVYDTNQPKMAYFER